MSSSNTISKLLLENITAVYGVTMFILGWSCMAFTEYYCRPVQEIRKNH